MTTRLTTTYSGEPGQIVLVTTSAGPMAILRSVAERLLHEGVISGELDGVLHAADPATVKAAMMTHGVCDFCSGSGIEHSFNVPDFEMPGGAGTSTGGWAACGICGTLILANKRKDLLARAIGTLAFAKFTKTAIADLHARFWRGMDGMADARGMADALTDFANNTLPDPPAWSVPVTEREARVLAISRLTGLSVQEITQIVGDGELPPELGAKFIQWGKRMGVTNAVTALRSIDALHKPLPYVVPHWQAALDAKFEVFATLRALMARVGGSEYFPEATDLTNPLDIEQVVKNAQRRQELKDLGFDEDARHILPAQAYSFNAETTAAIREASQSIPHTSPLSSIETPNTGSGWFWFSAPLPVSGTPRIADHTHALLWAWVKESPLGHGPALMFSAYVRDEKSAMPHESLTGAPLHWQLWPSTRWYWPFTLSFHDMIGLNTLAHRQVYGPGSPLDGTRTAADEANTMDVISELSLFFVMACLWFRQTVPGEPKKKVNPVLTTSEGHVERHARKRYQREHKLPDTPTVRVVALRKTARTAVEHAPAERTAGARAYQCRWIVQGHPRLQPCGPGRLERKLIWVEPYVKGPEDKELRTSTKVYAVIR